MGTITQRHLVVSGDNSSLDLLSFAVPVVRIAVEALHQSLCFYNAIQVLADTPKIPEAHFDTIDVFVQDFDCLFFIAQHADTFAHICQWATLEA